MFTLPVSKVLYCYSEYLVDFESMKESIPNLVLNEGLPSEDLMEQMSETREHWILVIDDLQESLTRSKEGAMILTRGECK